MEVVVLRLNHRQARDKRVTTHCGLVARAFGASSFALSGENDSSVLESLRSTADQWGGSFGVSYEAKWRSFLEQKRREGFKVVHLTMYGRQLREKLPALRREKKLLLVVGSAKVPADLYELADYNIAIGNQPHSEVAALAVFLHDCFGGGELEREFAGARVKIEPGRKGSLQVR